MDILTEKNLSSIYLANMDLIKWTVRLTSRRLKDGVNGDKGGYHYFSQLRSSLYQSPSKSGTTDK